MRDVEAWLDRIGLGKYAPTFAAQEVDLDTLLRLSEDDLRELGLPLGARRKILQAAATLPKADGPAPVPSTHDAGGAERRQITVMFADIVGSTSLAERIDIEDLRSLLLAYQQACASAIERYGGYVAQYLGDGVMAYFGYPRAHEHDAVSAVHAALTIVEGMRETNTRLVAAHGVGLEVRVGIHTGLVVAGEMGGGGTRERLAVGETPNLAARIQGAAEAGTVLVSDATWRLIDGFFTSEATGTPALKGVSQPTALYRVIAPTGVANPFEARAARVLTTLVGREAELSLLQKRWDQTIDGEGQAVLLQGEPGIGKSRLTRAFRESSGPANHHMLTLNCSSDHQASAFHPVVDQLRRALLSHQRETSDRPHESLRAYLTDLGLPADSLLSSLAALLDIVPDQPLSPADPAQRRRETLDALVQFVTTLSTQKPVLLTIEDAHWVDPSTEEFLGSLIDAIRSRPVMLLVTARPEYRAPWSGLAHFSTVSLNRLSRRETERMIREVASTEFPPEVLAQLVSRTDGIPLFIEELTTSVVDVAAHSPSPAIAVPATLQEALTARLDRVTPVREVLQVAALLGRIFDADIVQAATGMTSADVERALTDLMTAGLTYRRPHLGGQAFEFKHALIQEAALNTLVRQRRALLHGRIAEALHRVRPDTAERQPEILAHHFQEGGELKQAWALWRRAGDIATERSATREAVTHFTHAVECLKRLPPGAVSPDDEVAVYLGFSAALMRAEGYRSDKLSSTVISAHQAAYATGSSQLQGQVALHMAPVYYAQGRNKEYLRALDEVDRDTLHDDGGGLRAALSVTRGIAHYNRGELVDAEGCLRRAMGALRGLGRGAYPRLGGGDGLVVTQSYMARALSKLGKLDEAAQITAANVSFARTLGDPFSLAWALITHARSHYFLGADESALASADELIVICQERGFSARLANGLGARGMALARLGNLEQGIVDCRRALEIWGASGAVFTTVEYATNLADLLLKAGRIDDAARPLEEADRLVAGTDEAAYLAECQRLRGMIDAASGQFAAAERWFNEAILTAHNQSARLFELRATTSLTELLARQGRQAEAVRRLGEVYSAFTEGHRAPDLQAAKALLDGLA